jgi:hypothetical protein
MEIQLKNEKTISSLDLVKEINVFRQKEFEYKKGNGLKLGKVEEKNNKATELKHKTLMEIIRDEFEEEINEQKILPVEYKDKKGELRPMFILTLEQAKQIYSRESKFVRRRMIEYIKKLENENNMLKSEITKKDILLFNIVKSNNDIERAEAVNKYEMEYVKPLEIENKKQKEEIIEQGKVIEHKKEVIKGITGDITLLEKRQILNRIVRYKGSNYKERWNELYRVFKETYHIDIKARFEGYKLKYTKGMVRVTSKLDYAEKFGYLDKLFKIATKLYEDDMKEILENFREVITV